MEEGQMNKKTDNPTKKKASTYGGLLQTPGLGVKDQSSSEYDTASEDNGDYNVIYLGKGEQYLPSVDSTTLEVSTDIPPPFPSLDRRRSSTKHSVLTSSDKTGSIVAQSSFCCAVIFLLMVAAAVIVTFRVICMQAFYRCKNGVCIIAMSRCDGVQHCDDHSDELDCDCEGEGLYQCPALKFCIAPKRLCDTKNDCLFYEDETNCSSCSGFNCRNSEEWCLPNSAVCDAYRECPQGEDEAECDCVEGEVPCARSMTGRNCIQAEWWCDGKVDCPAGEDEGDHCYEIALRLYNVRCYDSYWCKNYRQCYDAIQRCDGTFDCADLSDESDCFRITLADELYVDYQGDYYAMCADNWNGTVVPEICKHLGRGDSGEAYTESIKEINVKWMVETAEAGNESSLSVRNILNLSMSSDCEKDKQIVLRCKNDDTTCGRIQDNLRKDYYNPQKKEPLELLRAERAIVSEYPWMAGIHLSGKFWCGGAIIDAWFVLTAAHCVDIYTNPSLYTVRLGTDRIAGPDASLQTLGVSEIISHPKYKRSKMTHDIAVFRLSKKIQFTENIRSICLPDISVSYKEFSICRASGWGKIDRQGKYFPPFLQATRLDILPDKTCSKFRDFRGIYNGESMLCAGAKEGVTICSGDSGGPLACSNVHSQWFLAGIVSFSGSRGIDVACSGLSVYTRIQYFVKWVFDVMKKKRPDEP